MSVDNNGLHSNSDLLTQFQRNVDKLNASKFKLFLRKICRLNSTEASKEVVQSVNNLKTILSGLGDLNYKELQKKLVDKDWHIDNLSRGETEKFYGNCTLLFQKIFPLLRESPYSRGEKMPKEVQHFLNPLIKKYRIEKQSHLENPAEHRLHRKIAKGQLAFLLGHGKKNNSGATGSLRIQDINKKNVGIFKIDIFETPLLTRIKNIIKVHAWGQLSYLKDRYLSLPQAEQAAYILDKELGLGLVPSSIGSEFGKKGVFQTFVGRDKVDSDNLVTHSDFFESDWDETKYVMFDAIKEKWNNKDQFDLSEIELVQRFFILDRLMVNLDRHEENWLVRVSKDGVITHIKAIDNANSFPVRVPKEGSLGAVNRFKWKNLNIASIPFTDANRNLVKEKLKEEDVKAYADRINSEIPDFLDDDMREIFVEGGKHILSTINNDGSTPLDLAK